METPETRINTGFFRILLVEGLHCREQDDVADGIRAAQHHAAPVDAEAQTAGGRHTVLQRHDEVLVHHVGLLVAVGTLLRLGLEALVLVDGVVQLAEGVAHLTAADEHLIPLGEGGLLGAALGQRADLHGVHGDEGGLDQRLLHLLVKRLVQGVAPSMRHAVHIHAHALGKLHALVGVADTGHEVGAGDVLHGVRHGHALPAGGQVDLVTQPLDMVGTQNFLGGAGEDALQNVHHAVQVGEGLIQLAGGEFRVMLGVHALVAEDAAHLVHPLHAAYDQTLQVQLRGDAQIHVYIQRIVVRYERPCARAGGGGVEHGGLDLYKVKLVQPPAYLGLYLGALYEGVSHLGIYYKVNAALAVSQFLILQPVELFGQGTEGL